MIFDTIIKQDADVGTTPAMKNIEEQHRLTMLSRFEQTLWRKGIRHVAGVDEAGRGPLAGPVVAAAVIFPPGMLIAGIDDSKKLTAAFRERLYERIVRSAAAYGVAVIDHGEIDRINILQATLAAMRNALGQLQLQPEYILVDGNMFSHESISYRTIVKGDSRSISIAAASIIAKVTRDRLMVQYHTEYPEYRFDKHKGYGTAEHIRAIATYGYCPIHRRSFHIRGIQTHE
jgi:ribonuclease HII